MDSQTLTEYGIRVARFLRKRLALGQLPLEYAFRAVLAEAEESALTSGMPAR